MPLATLAQQLVHQAILWRERFAQPLGFNKPELVPALTLEGAS